MFSLRLDTFLRVDSSVVLGDGTRWLVFFFLITKASIDWTTIDRPCKFHGFIQLKKRPECKQTACWRKLTYLQDSVCDYKSSCYHHDKCAFKHSLTAYLLKYLLSNVTFCYNVLERSSWTLHMCFLASRATCFPSAVSPTEWQNSKRTVCSRALRMRT